MGIICKDGEKRRKLKRQEANSNRQMDIENVTIEELQDIYEFLLSRKKFLEDTYGKILNTQNNDNEKPISIKDYQLMIDKLTKEVFQLEKINNLLENQNTQINFFFSTGQLYKINVDIRTKLKDAFKQALFNKEFKGKRYTVHMDRETKCTDDYFISTEKINYEQMKFLSLGEDVSEKFINNEPVSSLVNDSNSPISIIVQLRVSTQILSKNYYNDYKQVY